MSRLANPPTVLDESVSHVPLRRESEDARTVRKALKALNGKATVGDVSAATGLDFDRAETALKEVLASYNGHVAVGEAGDLLYSFDPKLIRRDHVPVLVRAGQAARALLATAFKVWIMLMLVVYFVLFLVLGLALIAGVSIQGGGRGGRPRGGSARVPFSIFDWFWAPRWGVRRPYYGRRHEERRDLRIPFYKKIFAFAFGPDDPQLTDEDRDQEVLQLVRARRGVATVPELVELNGLRLHEADQEMGRVVGRFGGDPRVSPKGELLFAFPDLMLSAHGPVVEDEPVPTWRKLERPKELTGNRKSTDGVIGALNGFNLIMAASSPYWLMPRLGLVGAGADFVLFQMPLVFSTLFFAIPATRYIALARENTARWTRNVRRAVIGHVYRATLERDAPVTVESALSEAKKYLKKRTPERRDVEEALHDLASEFDATVEAEVDGTMSFAFPSIRESFLAAAEARNVMRLEDRSLGDIVYASDDTPIEASERDMRNFERELKGYVAPPRRVRHLDDYEVAEFDRMLAAARRSPRFLRRGTEVRPSLLESARERKDPDADRRGS